MRKAKLALIVIILCALAFVVVADINVDKAYSFLVKQKQADGSYGSVIETAGAILALSNINYDTSAEVGYLLNNSDPQGCWPAGGCKIKDTAFSAMALHAAGKDVSNATDYLVNAQSVASLSGKWLLQIATNANGTCKISVDDASGNPVEKDVKVNAGYFPTCGNSTFLDINSCLQPGILNTRAPVELDVNCNDLGSVEVISTIFRAGNTFYLVDEERTARAQVNVENGCYGINRGGSCDYDASLWANIALIEIGEPATSEFYLRQSADPNSALHQAALTIITKDPLVAKNLVDLQRNDGSWDRNVLYTALAAKALKNTEFSAEAANAVEFYQEQQQSDGSIGALFDTEMVLWDGLPSVSVSQTCFEGQTRLCDLQDGVCGGSVELCTNGTFTGCNETTYLKFNSTFEDLEESCDGIDNDCDGSIDTGCDCLPGDIVACDNNFGVCANATQTCVNGTLTSCGYSDIPGFEASERTCSDKIDNDCDNSTDSDDDDCSVTSSICNEDDSCDYDRGEDQNNCADDCDAACTNGLTDPFEEGIDCGGPCTAECAVKAECVVNDICETSYGETAENCDADCYCGDGSCDNSEDELSCAEDCEGVSSEPYCGDGSCDADEDEESCSIDCSTAQPPDDSTTGGGFGIWLWAFLIIVLIGGGVYLWYRRKQNGGKSKPTPPRYGSMSSPVQEKKEDKPMFESLFTNLKKDKDQKKSQQYQMPVQQSRPSQPSRNSQIESELDKSIAEAKKLLNDKKK